MGAMSLLPGIPMVPFLGLGLAMAWLAWHLDRNHKEVLGDASDEKSPSAETSPDGMMTDEVPITDSLKMDDLKIEVGYALMPLVNIGTGSDKLTEQIKALRRTLASELGFVMPPVRILDNVMLQSNNYIIKVKEVEAGQGDVYPGQLMAMDPSGAQVRLPGQHVLEPTFGLPATWIDASLREEAQMLGYTVVDAATVIATHITEVIKSNVAELLSYADVQKLIRDLPKDHSELVKDMVPSQISATGVQRVLQGLLNERVSIRDLGTILEGISDAVNSTKSTREIIEMVRQRLARQLCGQYTTPAGQLPIITLSPQWETAFAESIVGQGDDRHLAMQPSKLTEFATQIREKFEEAARQGEMPVLVTSAFARPFIRSIVERFRRETPVLSQAEIHTRVRLKTVGSL
jgi:flagellar biosynthesis protein FlhA